MIPGKHQFYVGIKTYLATNTSIYWIRWYEQPIEVEITCDLQISVFDSTQSEIYNLEGVNYQAFYVPEFNEGNQKYCYVKEYQTIVVGSSTLDQTKEGDMVIFYN